MACKALNTIKDELGVPCGAGVHNAIETGEASQTRWGYRPKTRVWVRSSDGGKYGADFILYGPVEAADIISNHRNGKRSTRSDLAGNR